MSENDPSLFVVLERGPLPKEPISLFLLLHDEWNDWYEFETLYTLWYFEDKTYQKIGPLKIGQFDMVVGQKSPSLPNKFDQLDESFFSLANEDVYYEKLLKFDIRESVLRRLNDIALNSELFKRAINEKVTRESLLRSVPRETATGQFRRMALGGAHQDHYKFSFFPPLNIPPLEFSVDPESQPPTNIHVLIGRNGVGKTSLLQSMTMALVTENSKYGKFLFYDESGAEAGTFANLVSVSFSAFDNFAPLLDKKDKSVGAQYAYVGLRQQVQDISEEEFSRNANQEGVLIPLPKPPVILKNHEQLIDDFMEGLSMCRTGERRARWRNAIRKLESDPIFLEAQIYAFSTMESIELKNIAPAIFKRLSSGHQIVLLTLTKLVQFVEERTLVLLDEPEAHLHPPLLSAFVRAISDLLNNRNGVAIIATHSPIVLQEVPSDCVFVISRSGQSVKIESPKLETFGENAGILTNEVFGLEVVNSGFHKMIHEKVEALPDYFWKKEIKQIYDDVLKSFDKPLGGEASAILLGLINNKRRKMDEDI